MADAVLAGAVFEGHLQPPGMGKSKLTYEFADSAKAPPLPAAIKNQRRALGWGCKDQEVSCFSATCNVPDLGLEAEEVMISVDPPAPDGSRRMLLQSLKRPDLGVSILQLESGSSRIVGGDETWSPGEEPIIRAKRSEKTSSPSKASKKAEGSPVSPSAADTSPSQGRTPAPPSTPSSGNRRPPARDARVRIAASGTEPDAEPMPGASKEEVLLGFGVVGGSDGAGDEEVDTRMPLPIGHTGDFWSGESRHQALGDSTAQRGAGSGGIGRSLSTAAAQAAPKAAPAPAGYSDEDDSRSLRPDLATGEPGAAQQDKKPSPSALDEEIRAASAANQERLVSAAAAGETGDVRLFLVKTGVTADAAAPQGKCAGLTALMAAAQRGRLEAVELLLEKKATLDVRDASGWTALMHAVHGQRIEVAKTLLGAGAEFQQGAEGDSGVTPLILSAAGARPEFCKLLLSKKARLEARDSEGCRALHHAARRGHGGAVVALLAARARLDEHDGQGRTPFLAAVAAGRAETVTLLLSNGADSKAMDSEGRGAKELATAYEHERVLKVLEARP
eukprot:TRINITY_DN28076_c0_g1_i1.p1 TRINITY_DN28076_c0_g1~~TRINITY_DN28076_c0_g1_i1.p1  ORF type:complete len:561 (+),score=111.09 TRINITY_DN28076_c0_g1_i1:103-1785(+)